MTNKIVLRNASFLWFRGKSVSEMKVVLKEQPSFSCMKSALYFYLLKRTAFIFLYQNYSFIFS